MPLLITRQLSLAYGLTPLLSDVSFSIEKGERIALIGRNGEGKSTLLRVIASLIKPDAGDCLIDSGCRIAYLPQEVPQDLHGCVREVVLGGAGELLNLLQQYHHCDPQSARWASLHEQLDRLNAWDYEFRAQREISRLELNADADFASLSGGMKRRALLARALISEPDLLLLDEPTNHLDVRSIEWMEKFLRELNCAQLFITHDRTFLQNLATRILELDRGVLRDYPENWSNYLRRRQEVLHAEAKQNANFDKKLAQEEVWIRQGIKARRTRNEGRVRALEQLRRERAARREQQGLAQLSVQQAERSGKTVIETRKLSFSYGNTPLVEDLDLLIERGDKIALIGDNGVGKTTLIRLLLKQLQPTSGEVLHGTRLEVAYFDQLRNALDENRSVQDNVADGADFIDVNGERRHVMSWLQDFLFSPARVRTPVSALSGGERNRLLLAKLFTKPCNVLIMDEPTNDLDIETLELLEELLTQYSGTLLFISHDRDFVDNVATSVLACEGNGNWREYVGGYKDWVRQRVMSSVAETKPKTEKSKTETPIKAAKNRKLGFNEQRELEQLPARIEQLEKQVNSLQTRLADPAFYREHATQATQIGAELTHIETELQNAYERWETLEALRG